MFYFFFKFTKLWIMWYHTTFMWIYINKINISQGKSGGEAMSLCNTAGVFCSWGLHTMRHVRWFIYSLMHLRGSRTLTVGGGEMPLWVKLLATHPVSLRSISRWKERTDSYKLSSVWCPCPQLINGGRGRGAGRRRRRQKGVEGHLCLSLVSLTSPLWFWQITTWYY